MRRRYHIDEYSCHGHVTSKPVPDGHLPVHPPSFLVLRECGQGRVIVTLVFGYSSQATLTVQPATLRAATLMTMRYIELVMRPPSDVVISTLKPLRGPSFFMAPRGPASYRFAFAPLAAVTQSPTSPAERKSTAKPAQEAISTLRGEGTRGTAGSRGQVWGRVRGRLQTILPPRHRSPNLGV